MNDVRDYKLRWELIKHSIAETTRKYSKIRAQRQRGEEVRLRTEQDAAIARFSLRVTDQNLDRLKEIESELRLMAERRAKGAILRSRCQWLQEGERGNSYFLGLEKSRGAQKFITTVETEEGVFTGEKEVQQQLELYLSALLKENKTPESAVELSQQFLDSVQDRRLEGEDYWMLEQPISEEEIEAALLRAPKGKVPGIDGLSNELLKEFWPQLKQHFMLALDQIYVEKLLFRLIRHCYTLTFLYNGH